MSKNVVTNIKPLSFPMETLDPFLFCVYHKDYYPAGDEKMRAPRRGDGADFDSRAPYRMYHGDEIPGFPQHPHRGFETLTATLEGLTDHSDSQGNAGRYGNGDLQWMTAGKGVVHGENFPLINKDKPNTLKLFQIWLNLPRKSKMVDPAFVMVSSLYHTCVSHSVVKVRLIRLHSIIVIYSLFIANYHCSSLLNNCINLYTCILLLF
ncbi:pirin family protein [archaeon]|nr:MAG: pirin family protein [archaeon]